MCWRKLNKYGAIAGILGGLAMGFVGWLVAAHTLLGGISTTTLTGNQVILAGSLSALGTGAIVAIVWSLIAPADFDFELTRAIGTVRPDQPEAPVGNGEKDAETAPVQTAKRNEAALTAVQGGGRTVFAEAEYAEGVIKLEQSQTRFRLITGALLLIARESSPRFSRVG